MEESDADADGTGMVLFTLDFSTPAATLPPASGRLSLLAPTTNARQTWLESFPEPSASPF
jgi:hypothetical protein